MFQGDPDTRLCLEVIQTHKSYPEMIQTREPCPEVIQTHEPCPEVIQTRESSRVIQTGITSRGDPDMDHVPG